jgi:hypothetical protein
MTSRTSWVGFVGCGLALLGSAGGATPELKAVALVAALAGQARIVPPGTAAPKPLALFDRLPAGTRIETEAGATLLLVYRSGERVRVASGTAVTVSSRDVAISRGRVERLSPVRPLPAFDPPAVDLRRPGVAAVRIRGDGIDGLYPSGGARTIAEATVLAFAAPGGPGSFTVEIENALGRVVFAGRTAGPSLAVPAEALVPGGEYVWRVSARSPAGVAVRGEAAFATLSAGEAAWRADVRRTVASSAQPPVWLAEIDLGLGLWHEARDGFRAAVGVTPGGADVIAARLEALAGILGAGGAP